MARRLDHRRDLLQPDLYHQREVQGEAMSANTPDGERANRGRRESSACDPRLSPAAPGASSALQARPREELDGAKLVWSVLLPTYIS